MARLSGDGVRYNVKRVTVLDGVVRHAHVGLADAGLQDDALSGGFVHLPKVVFRWGEIDHLGQVKEAFAFFVGRVFQTVHQLLHLVIGIGDFKLDGFVTIPDMNIKIFHSYIVFIIYTCPEFTKSITPPHMHISLLVLVSVGKPWVSTCGFPGAQGAVVQGTHGIGVSTPQAAEVADATVGLARERHIPKVGILTIGLLSMILATNLPCIMELRGGNTTRGTGVIPILHFIVAPIHTVFTSPAMVERLKF